MSARSFVRLLLLLLVLAAGQMSAGVGASAAVRLSGSFTPLAPGLEVAEAALSFDGGGGGDAAVEVTLLRVDPAVREVRIVTPAALPPAAGDGHTLRGYLDGLDATAAAAGSLLASFRPPEPLGLVVSAGRVVSPPHRSWASSGLFCAGGPDGAASIRPVGPDARPDGGTTDCLQSGPLLIGPEGVASAERLRRSIGVDYGRDFVEGRHPRTFVALDRRGRLLLGATGPLDLPRLGAFLAVAAEPGVLDLAAALNLTGAETAGLLLRTDGGIEVRAGSPDGLPLPNAIAVLGPRGPGVEPAAVRAPTPSPAG
ncbi:MAG TPA: phosphodiester glycosidase family protein [Geminicoccaceae bacterium]|nr:phosphodiester glycosidase family protein [Geminicoccaceae bacterium]